MLSDHNIGAVLLSKDLTKARAFYVDQLGLEVLSEDDSALTLKSGTSQLTVTASTTGSKDEQTKASWQVEDLRAELAVLAQRGVEPEQYDSDELTTDEQGVADQGSAWVAYIMDPDGNALGIEQTK
jgi:catechol-2,3-dioxygenase